MKKLVLCLLAFLVVAPVLAQQYTPCMTTFVRVSGKLTSPQQYTLSWDPVPGAIVYSIDEQILPSQQSRTVTRQFTTRETSLTIEHESINDITYSYRLRAFGNTAQCETFSQPVKTLGDQVLRRAVRRGIIPVVGSARGANGAVFKTYLKLEGVGQHGKVIFHPANRVASDDDPSLPYAFDGVAKLEWDDVVAAMGQSGIGSLSIVPAENETLPRATVRLYNMASNGIYGANTEMYPGVGFLEVTPFQRIDLPADGNFRANVGARALLAGTARALFIGADGSLKKMIDRTFVAGEVAFGSPEAVYGASLEPGESLIVTFPRAIVPFYTLTDNRTNDPFLYVQGVERTDVVDQYVK